ncbi:hypothetical protein MKW94_011666, partial [Papaver nudicaule]|nr:hypothetical protein [Papaver nudicaule]
ALGGSSDILDSHPPLEFYHLRLLKLSVGLSRDTMRTIFYILKSSPNIESLYLRSEKDSSDTPLYPFCDE